ncbi:MAG: Gx transporter family protein [Clostridiales bacterium]|nr:Gx transporter family protein [Clostridiales bacterium]
MSAARRVAVVAVLFAAAAALSIVESALPPVPFMPPQIRIGLANCAVLLCAYGVGAGEAALLAVLKALLTLAARGAVAFALSLSGGLLAAGVTAFCIALTHGRIAPAAVSVFGAVAHTFGQCAAYAVITGTTSVFFYAGILIVASAACGAATGAVAAASAPLLKGARWRGKSAANISGNSSVGGGGDTGSVCGGDDTGEAAGGSGDRR